MQRENKWKNEKETKDLLSWSRKRILAENPSWFQSEKLRHDKCHPEYHYPDSMTDKETMSITISLGFTLLIPTSQGLLCNYYTVSHLDNSSPQTLPSSLSRYAAMDLLTLASWRHSQTPLHLFFSAISKLKGLSKIFARISLTRLFAASHHIKNTVWISLQINKISTQQHLTYPHHQSTQNSNCYG